MDFHQVTRLIQILQDGAVSPEEGKELLDGVVIVLDSVRPQLKKWWLRVILYEIKVSLMGLKEHLESIDYG